MLPFVKNLRVWCQGILCWCLFHIIYLQYYVALLYRDRISHSQIILAGQFHITNFNCRNKARHLCTTWVTLDYDSIFSLYCNQKVWGTLPPKNTFLNSQFTSLLLMLIPQSCILTFPVVKMYLLRLNKWDVRALLHGLIKLSFASILLLCLLLYWPHLVIRLQNYCYHSVLVPVYIYIKPSG